MSLSNEMQWDMTRRPRAQVQTSVATTAAASAAVDMMMNAVFPDANKQSIIHVFGTTRQGESVHCEVRGFLHYIWAEIPACQATTLRPEEVQQLQKVWNKVLAYRPGQEPIHAIEIHRRESGVYYKGPDAARDYMKITLSTPKDLYAVRKYLRGESAAEHGAVQWLYNQQTPRLVLYEEECVDYQSRFMCELGLVGFGWLRVPLYHWNSQGQQVTRSTCSIDVVVDFSLLRCLPDERHVAPIRVFDFDIECYATTKSFPSPDRDPIIQIAVQIHDTGSDGTTCVLDAVLHTRPTEHFADKSFAPNSSAPNSPERILLVEYANERDMLLGFQRLVTACDYDVSRNFNGRGFDWAFLFGRAANLGIERQFSSMSRLRGVPATLATPSTFESGARGKRTFHDACIPGRTDFDILHIVRCEEKLKQYNLNTVSLTFLGQTKEDVHHSMINVLYDGTPADRSRLARYCRKDAMLPRLIDDKQMYLIRYIEQARVCRVTLDQLVQRGQQVKVLAQLLQLAREFHYVLPLGRIETGYEPEGQYDGGLVLEPEVGFHTEPLACLDFASLYPSECSSENIDYTTLLRPRDAAVWKRERPQDVFIGPAGHAFVRAHVRRGMLCILEDRLLAARAVAKKDLKRAREEGRVYEGKVQDARQAALKLSANSAYGFTGVGRRSGAKFTCFEVSETITACGRRDLQSLEAWLKVHYPAAQIMYGDTDSIMVKPGKTYCPENTVKQAMDWMHKVAGEINADLFANRKPMKLAPEKVMCPTLFQAKKRYAAAFFETNPDKPDKLYTRGLETIRRDICELVSGCLEACMERVFLQRDVAAAIACAKETVQRLYLNQVDMSELLITKSLSQEVEEYSTKQAHSVLAEKMQRRDMGSAPVVGDRVPYIMVGEGCKNVSDLAEDPIYALEHEVPPNVEYYIENQLRKPLERLFIPIIGAPRTGEIFNGSHTRKRIRPVAASGKKASAASILSFAVVRRSCGNCHAPYDPAVHKHPSLCPNCMSEHGEEAREEKLAACAELKQAYDVQFKVCQDCQGSDRDPVLCMARDCSQLYKRKGLEYKLARATKDIEDMAGSAKKSGAKKPSAKQSEAKQQKI